MVAFTNDILLRWKRNKDSWAMVVVRLDEQLILFRNRWLTVLGPPTVEHKRGEVAVLLAISHVSRWILRRRLTHRIYLFFLIVSELNS